MKKILIYFSCIVAVILLSGCSMENTPTKRVENFLNSYTSQDNTVLNQLKDMINSDTMMDNNQKNIYSDIMKRQYKDMTYEIKDETIDGNNATVDVEIEVYNYKKVIDDVNNYLENNQSEFLDETNTVNIEKFNDYKLQELKNAKDKVTYTLNLTLKKVNDKWTLDNLTDTEISKIHGMYNA